MTSYLKDMEPRALVLAMIGILGLTLVASYLYLYKKPLAELSTQRSLRVLLQAKVEGGAHFPMKMERLKTEVDSLQKQLSGKAPMLPVSQMMAHIIQRLDEICGNHKIKLLGVKPGRPNKIPRFEEIPFSVEVCGGYFALYEWLHETEQEMGPMAVKNFHIKPKTNSKEVTMTIDLVYFRPIEVGT